MLRKPKTKRPLLRLLAALVLAVGSIVALPSPAQAFCQSEPFRFEGGGSYACTGEHWPGDNAFGFTAGPWSGYFQYTVEGVRNEHRFCDGDWMTTPAIPFYPGNGSTQWDRVPITVQYLYLSPVRASWCPGAGQSCTVTAGSCYLERHPAAPVDLYRVPGGTLLTAEDHINIGKSQLRMQLDGNLVLYDHTGLPRWATGTWQRGWYALFQSDGNLVVYAYNGAAVWASNTCCHIGQAWWLAVQDDGNMVIYDPSYRAHWATHTNW